MDLDPFTSPHVESMITYIDDRFMPFYALYEIICGNDSLILWWCLLHKAFWPFPRKEVDRNVWMDGTGSIASNSRHCMTAFPLQGRFSWWKPHTLYFLFPWFGVWPFVSTFSICKPMMQLVSHPLLVYMHLIIIYYKQVTLYDWVFQCVWMGPMEYLKIV